MPRNSHPRLLMLALPLFAALVAGCSSPWKQDSIVYSGGNEGVFLYIEHREDEEGARTSLDNSHPYNVESDQLAFLLDRLNYEHKPFFSSIRASRVFTPEQVQYIADPMSEAFAEIGPDQRLRFLVVDASIGRLLTGLTGTSGVAFRRGETFHIAFDTIEEGINDGDGGRPENVVFSEDPTDTEYGYGLAIPFVGAAIHLDPENGRVFKRWIEIPNASWLAAMQSAREESKVAAQESGKKPADSKSDAPEKKPAKDPDELDSAQRAELDKTGEQLKKLEYLKNEGAITEEQYRAQVKELLEKI